MKRFTGALILTMGLMLPLGVAIAQDHPQDRQPVLDERPRHDHPGVAGLGDLAPLG